MSGTLMIVGGNLSNSRTEIIKKFIEKVGDGKIGWIVTATGEHPDDTFRKSSGYLIEQGFPKERCVLIPLYKEGVVDERGFNAGNGDNPELLASLDGVKGVWFTGGSQYNTCKVLLRSDGSDTLFLSKLRELYANGGIIGGSSAGAAIMSRSMILWGDTMGALCYPVIHGMENYPGSGEKYPASKPLMMARGLGFFEAGVVDQHFNTRPRMIRSIESAFADPEGRRVVYSISEDTAMCCENGGFTVMGSATVYVFDCRRAVRTSAGNCKGIMMHALNRGDRFNTEDLSAELLGNERADSRKSGRNIVSGCVTDGKVFDDALHEKLLLGTPGSLYHCDDCGKDYLKGAALYDTDGGTKLVELRYMRGSDTAGYRDVHTSFTGVELSVSTTDVQM